MALHIVLSKNCNWSLLYRMLTKEDALIFMDDASIYAMKHMSPSSQSIYSKKYVLADDLLVRGLSEEVNHSITPIDYPQLVKLTEQHHPIISWQ